MVPEAFSSTTISSNSCLDELGCWEGVVGYIGVVRGNFVFSSIIPTSQMEDTVAMVILQRGHEDSFQSFQLSGGDSRVDLPRH
jgi:hypothetical protein